MKTVYIVFYRTDMLWAFETREAAETYITRVCSGGMHYDRDTLYVKSVEFLTE